MIQIRPVSDLRNKFTEIEATVKEGNPVYLTKNGYGIAGEAENGAVLVKQGIITFLRYAAAAGCDDAGGVFAYLG